jgi:chemotaxis response regulator CheB
MDLIMPFMDGVEATRRIMADTPCPILIVTANVDANAARAFAAMGHGAIDAIDTPTANCADLPARAQPLLTKIEAIGKLIGKEGAQHSGGAIALADRLVAIGASAGGPAALCAVLEGLPRNFTAAIIIVQHVDARFAPSLVDWLGQHSPLPVRIAAEGDRPAPGQVLVAGTAEHLVFKTKDRLGYTDQPSGNAYCPSVDIFMHSAAQQWRGPIVGVLLTGMGADGAAGLKALRTLGHHTIAQDRETSAVYGMPKAAAAIAAAVDILPLDSIAPRLTELFTPTRPLRIVK